MVDAQVVSLADKKCSDLLSGLVISPWQPNVFQEDGETTTDTLLEKQLKESLENLSISNKMACSLCGCTFLSRLQQTDHYKLDWHRFNLKQNLMGKPSVSEETFESMTVDYILTYLSNITYLQALTNPLPDSPGQVKSHSGTIPLSIIACQGRTLAKSPQRHIKREISSISGSDEDDRDLNTTSSAICDSAETPTKRGTPSGNRRLPKVFFQNNRGHLVAIYRCLLQSKKEGLLTQSELVSRATGLPSNLNWAILMTAAGHFAAAIFNGSEIVAHKTFHRYTVRAKRGTAQGVRDSQQGGHAPRSAGAALRRYNEAQLQENVGNLLKSWQEQLDKCSCIFVRAPSYNRSVIFSGKKSILKTDDLRLRTIPFATRRPTLKEVKRVWSILSSIDYFDDAEAVKSKFLSPPVSQKEKNVTKDEALQSPPTKNEQVLTVPSSVVDEDIDSHTPGVKVETNEDSFEKFLDGSQSDGSEESTELILEEVESSTSHLQESEIFIPKQRRGRRRKKKKSDVPKAEVVLQDKQLRKIQAAMFTSCKIGDEATFERKLVHLREKFLRDMEEEGGKLLGERELISIGETFVDKADGAVSVTSNSKQSPSKDASESSIPSISDTSNNHIEEDGTATQSNQKHVEYLTSPQEKMGEISKRIQSFLNEKLDSSGNLLLHVAAVEGQSSLVWKLLSNGANPALKNGKHQPPFAIAKDKPTRQQFRTFMGQFPEKYDYRTAQIPAPLSAEEESERASKAAEKRREQKKAKRKKQKEQKEEQQRFEEEEREKQAFAALSDREKRALAAEKRLTNQLSSTNRCFTCATNLDGKVPFHYADFKFCSMDCLKRHKQGHQV